MKVYVLTYHRSYSYGACLQAYATWKYLEDKGVECKFINYENEYEARMRNGKWLQYESIKSKIAIITKKIFFSYDKYCKKAYKNFYKLLPQIEEHEIEKDAILAVGSDQMWNPDICNGMDVNLYLEKFPDNKKITLATSAGGYIFNREEKEVIKSVIHKFEAISVRENVLLEQLKEMYSGEISIILDPTFWISRDEWKKLTNAVQVPNEKYILVFTFTNTSIKVSDKIIEHYKRELGINVYRIMLNTFKSKGVDRVIAGPTPLEFVKLIDNAELVITNSFHGVAFSINMNTPFVFIPVNNKNNDRMLELLERLKLTDRVVLDEENIISASMDYSTSNKILKLEQEKTWNVIEQMIF